MDSRKRIQPLVSDNSHLQCRVAPRSKRSFCREKSAIVNEKKFHGWCLSQALQSKEDEWLWGWSDTYDLTESNVSVVTYKQVSYTGKDIVGNLAPACPGAIQESITSHTDSAISGTCLGGPTNLPRWPSLCTLIKASSGASLAGTKSHRVRNGSYIDLEISWTGLGGAELPTTGAEQGGPPFGSLSRTSMP